MSSFAVILRSEHFRRFGTDFLEIVIPRASPFGPTLPFVFRRIEGDAVTRPKAEARFQPIFPGIIAVRGDGFAQYGRARPTLLGGASIKPFYVFVREISENTSHDIMISYRDIVSS